LITNVLAPASGTDAANKTYVETLSQLVVAAVQPCLPTPLLSTTFSPTRPVISADWWNRVGWVTES